MKSPSLDRVVSISVAATLLFVVALMRAEGGAAAYRKLDVDGRVEVKVPQDWKISDEQARQRVATNASDLLGGDKVHVAALSAISGPGQRYASIRVSFLEVQPPLSQKEIRSQVRKRKSQTLDEVASSWRADSPHMWDSLAKVGLKEVGSASFRAEPLGGQLAIVIAYRRTSNVPGQVVTVEQYHVALGAQKALITLSYTEGDDAARVAHDRIKKSIVIH